MKYYFIGNDGNEISIDLSQNSKYNNGIRAFKVRKDSGDSQKMLVKNIAGKNYISRDGQSWNLLPRIMNLGGVVNVNETMNVYRGFRPSGLFNAAAGDLVTDMPGKIVKVMAQEGSTVQIGDTLLILEAMKMENEIKSSMDGVIKAVHVKEGETVDSGTLMIEIE